VPDLRRFYIYNRKQINEQACYDQGLRHLAEGNSDAFEVHYHASGDECPSGGKPHQLSPYRSDKDCYRIEYEGPGA